MGMTYERAKNIILNKYKDSVVLSAFDTPSGYIFSIQPKTCKKNEYILDGFFKVIKATGKIEEYSPVKDPEDFKRARKNRVE